MDHADKKTLEGPVSDLPKNLTRFRHLGGDNTINGVNWSEFSKDPEFCKQLQSNLPKSAIARDFRDLEEGEK